MQAPGAISAFRSFT